MKEIKNVCVYCASSTRIASCYVEAADQLGQILGNHHLRVITGGGIHGLMKTVEEAAMRTGAEVYGIIPHFMVEQHWEHPNITKLIEVNNMSDRKNLMNKMADAIVVLPGGCGTLDELTEAITLKQLGHFDGPIVILNINCYYDALIAQLQTALNQHFMGEIHSQLWSVANNTDEVINQIYNAPEWDKDLSKFAVI